MNVKSQDPRDLVLGLLTRSICAIQVAAILVDNHGAYAWGWNSVGGGYGLHAEAHCLSRANKRRLSESIMYVAARRARNKKVLTARPCALCEPKVRRVGKVIYRNAAGEWVEMD